MRLVETVRREPFRHQIDTLVMWGDERVYLGLGKIRAIALMIRITDFEQVFFQHVKVRLGKTDAETDGVLWMR